MFGVAYGVWGRDNRFYDSGIAQFGVPENIHILLPPPPPLPPPPEKGLKFLGEWGSVAIVRGRHRHV